MTRELSCISRAINEMEPTSQDPFPRLPGGSQTIRAESGGGGEAEAGVWTGPATPGAPGSQAGGSPSAPHRPPLPSPLCRPGSGARSSSAGPPSVQVRGPERQTWPQFVQLPPTPGSALLPKHRFSRPTASMGSPPLEAKPAALHRPFNSSHGCRNSNCCITHSGSALLMRLGYSIQGRYRVGAGCESQVQGKWSQMGVKLGNRCHVTGI